MKEVVKPIKLSPIHADKIAELQKHYKVSSRKIGQIVIAVGGDLESIPKKNRRFEYPDNKKVSNIFIPFSKQQFDKATKKSKKDGYDFTSWFKFKLDDFYASFKSGSLNLENNKIAKKILDF